jgi:hypothetical protein
MRMGMLRFTRLTNGFSKKAENHAHTVSLHFLHYNFGRVHHSLRARRPNGTYWLSNSNRVRFVRLKH